MTLSPRARVLVITSVGSFISPFISTFLSFAVPAMGNSLKASFTLMIWVPIAFMIPLTSFTILIGKLSDAYGRSLFYQVGLVIFGASSVVAAFSQGVYSLIAFVFAIGVGSSFLSVNTIAILSNVFPPNLRGRAFGINSMAVYIGLTTAPVVSGFVIEYLGWRVMFYVVAVLALIIVLPARRLISKLDVQSKRLPIDLPGFFIFLASVLSIALYLSFSEIYGLISTLYLLVLGVALLVVLILYERRREFPILEMRLFTRSRTFTGGTITAFLIYISTFAIVFVFSIYLTVIEGLHPSTTGLILTAEPIMMVIFSPISGRLSDRFGSRGLASIGMLIIAVSFLAIYFMLGKVEPGEMVWPLAVIGIGFGLFSAPNTNSVMSSVSRQDSGSASGILSTMRFVGQLMSISIMGSILAVSMPRTLLLELFSGISSDISAFDVTAFVGGMKEGMLIASILCFIGVFTSLFRNR